MTNFEKAFANMTPAQRKKATAAISGQMGMLPKKKASSRAALPRKKTTKK